jgi:hypothetical protein
MNVLGSATMLRACCQQERGVTPIQVSRTFSLYNEAGSDGSVDGTPGWIGDW